MNILRAQVREFHRVFGVAVLNKPQVPSEEIVRLRLKLITEEFLELLDASLVPDSDLDAAAIVLKRVIASRALRVDLPEFVDALSDLDYVVEGTRLSFGVDGAPVAAEVHRANMAKAGPGSTVRDDGKILKPPGWTPPDIARELRRQGWEP